MTEFLSYWVNCNLHLQFDVYYMKTEDKIIIAFPLLSCIQRKFAPSDFSGGYITDSFAA